MQGDGEGSVFVPTTYDDFMPESLDDLVEWLDLKDGTATKTQEIQTLCFAGDLKHLAFKPSADDDIFSTITANDDALIMGLDPGMLSLMDPLAEASLDSFMDLSTFFNEGSNELLTDGAAEIKALIEKTTPAGVAMTTAAATPSLKRTLDEVEAEVTDVVDMEEEVVVTTTTDHDYVSKRPRMSTSSDISEECWSESAAASPEPGVPEGKYRQRRNKNNVASRRSREIRKQKFIHMDVESTQLEIDNEKLKVKIVDLEALAKEMKAILVAKLSGK